MTHCANSVTDGHVERSTLTLQPAIRAFFSLLEKEREKEGPAFEIAFEIAEARTSQSCFLSSTSLSESGNPCTKRTVLSFAWFKPVS